MYSAKLLADRSQFHELQAFIISLAISAIPPPQLQPCGRIEVCVVLLLLTVSVHNWLLTAVTTTLMKWNFRYKTLW